MSKQYPRFVAALIALGKTDGERARKLGVSTKTIARYRAEQLPDPVDNLLKYPHLLRELAEDAAQPVEQAA
jgi:hypothetical protein